jgi:hypothetical protein
MKANLFISCHMHGILPLSLFPEGSLWLPSWSESVFLILVCHDFPRTWQQAPSTTSPSFIDSIANPPEMKRKPPMKNGS